MSDYWKGVSTAIIGAGVVGIVGYLLIVKENQIKIDALTKTVDELRMSEGETQKSLNSTRLFVAQAHPDRILGQTSSLKKLQALDSQEIELLAEGLPELKVSGSNEVLRVPLSLKSLVTKYNFSDQDLAAFRAVAQPYQAGEM